MNLLIFVFLFFSTNHCVVIEDTSYVCTTGNATEQWEATGIYEKDVIVSGQIINL